MPAPDVSVVIPFRPDGAWRSRSLEWVVARYQALHPAWQVIVRVDTGDDLFPKARLVNEGCARATGDVVVVADADLIVPHPILDQAVDQAAAGTWTVPYSHVRRLTEHHTMLMATSTPDTMPGPHWDLAQPEQTVCVGGGIVVIGRDELVDAGGMDERFVGWGYEDSSWGAQLTTFAGPPTITEGVAWHLFHPSARSSKHKAPDGGPLRKRYVDAQGDIEAMRALLAERNGALCPST